MKNNRKKQKTSAILPKDNNDIVVLPDEYEVEKIIGVKKVKNVEYYQVKWVGYPSCQNTWEPEEHLTGCLDLLEEFKKNKNKKKYEKSFLC